MQLTTLLFFDFTVSAEMKFDLMHTGIDFIIGYCIIGLP
jgi:hypothetical protein